MQGTIAVDNAELDDMVLRRPDGSPTYNLCVVVDDHEQGVTHVLRGDDHINNTPRQILLYQALGFPLPAFGHVPLIHGQDKKKLSKRHGAASALEFRAQGFLPQALRNYLVRLGWSHGDQELFTLEELKAAFSTKRLNKAAAAFDLDKLLWMNSQYIQQASPAELAPLLVEQLAARGFANVDVARAERIVPLYQPRAKTLVEMAEAAELFVIADEALAYDDKAVAKVLTAEARGLLAELRERLAQLDHFSEAGLEAAAKAFIEAKGIAFKQIAQPIRVAVTGRTASPGLFETMAVLGKASALARLDRALAL